MIACRQKLEDLPRDLPLALDRLIRIGVGAHGDRIADVAGFGKLGSEELRSIRLGEELGFEVEPWREIEIRVRRPRVAIDASVLASLIRIDRLREPDVGRVVAGDDGARALHGDSGLERRKLLVALRGRRFPAVVRRLSRVAAEAIAGIESRAAPFERRLRSVCQVVSRRAWRPW